MGNPSLTRTFQHGEEFPPGRGKGDWFQRERTEEEEEERDEGEEGVREENEGREDDMLKKKDSHGSVLFYMLILFFISVSFRYNTMSFCKKSECGLQH